MCWRLVVLPPFAVRQVDIVRGSCPILFAVSWRYWISLQLSKEEQQFLFILGVLSVANSPADHLPVALMDPSCPRDASLVVVPSTCRVAAHEANRPYDPLRMGREDHLDLLILASAAAGLLAFVGHESVAGIDVNYELVKQRKHQQTNMQTHFKLWDINKTVGTISNVRDAAITNRIFVLMLTVRPIKKWWNNDRSSWLIK